MGAEDQEEVEGEEVVVVGERLYLVAIRCTRNGSPRGQLTLFSALQYGQIAIRRTALFSPVEPTTLIPR